MQGPIAGSRSGALAQVENHICGIWSMYTVVPEWDKEHRSALSLGGHAGTKSEQLCQLWSALVLKVAGFHQWYRLLMSHFSFPPQGYVMAMELLLEAKQCWAQAKSDVDKILPTLFVFFCFWCSSGYYSFFIVLQSSQTYFYQ